MSDANDWVVGKMSYEDLVRQIEKRPNMFKCHCGDPIYVHKDLDNFTRGLCKDCDAVRCDAYPGECGK